jgi:asparagine synthase (glutamine-hydrolysing)
MCGLAGFVGRGSRETIRQMTSSIAYRGPDGDGHWSDDQVGIHLGHRILSILDRAGGAQPMWDGGGDIGVVFNGEIYNHVELRAELIAAGHRFRSSHSDTEVLIHGYKQWGNDLPIRLNGMFAFAILDRPAKRLFLARDRFGEKPLYYASTPDAFVFGSEVGALRQHPSVSSQLSPRAVQKYLAWGFLPAPLSLYADVRKLGAGASLSLDLETRDFRIDTYWNFSLTPDDSLQANDEARLSEELRHLLQESVRRRLVSDVPIGLFLSGGIDSGCALAGAAQFVPASELQTFTIGFTDPSYDESTNARALAEAVGTRHHEQILDLERSKEILPDLLQRLDEPLGDPSILPTYLLCQFARQHVTVALSGDGGDELFAGYDPFKALNPARIYSSLVPRGVHRGLRKLADLLPRSTQNMSFDFKVRRALLGLSWPQALWNPVWLSPADPDLISEIFERPLSAEELYEEALDLWSAQEKDLVDRTLEFYTKFYLTDDILTKVDRASMLNSLETRAVFLDNDVVDFCRRLPNRFKFRGGERKVLLRRALTETLPNDVLTRPKKGFGIPVTRWLRGWQKPVVDPQAAHRVGLKIDAVGHRWDAHANIEQDNRMLLFAWMSLAPHLRAQNLSSTS